MQKLFYSFVILLITFSAAKAQFLKAEVRAEGLTCSLCSNTTYTELKSLSFIDSLDIDFGHSFFVLYFKHNLAVDFDSIRKKVEDAGFSVTFLRTTYKFNNLAVDSISCFNFQSLIFCFLNGKPQTLNGDVALQIIDKGFVTKDEFKKYATQMYIHPYNQYIPVYHVIY